MCHQCASMYQQCATNKEKKVNKNNDVPLVPVKVSFTHTRERFLRCRCICELRKGGTGGTGGTDLGNVFINNKLRCVRSGTKVAQEVAQAAQRWHSLSHAPCTTIHGTCIRIMSHASWKMHHEK